MDFSCAKTGIVAISWTGFSFFHELSREEVTLFNNFQQVKRNTALFSIQTVCKITMHVMQCIIISIGSRLINLIVEFNGKHSLLNWF